MERVNFAESMKKVKAFTLLELLIGMIVSTIVIGFCYTGNSIIYKQYCNYKDMKREITDAIQLNSILNNDITTAEMAEYTDGILLLNSNGIEPLQYDFEGNYILRRRGEMADTFKFASVKNISADNLEQSDQLSITMLTNLSFDIIIHEEIKHFHFTKSYMAETLVNMQLPYLKND